MSLFIAILAGLFLAYANGANDNFKGVATLFGSGTTDYRRALIWATLTTGLGCWLALFFAQGLLNKFSGKGLLPDTLLRQPSFAVALALAGASTVMLATRFGFPISTTHALVGGLIGVGLAAAPQQLHLAQLGQGYFAPLLLSPLLALSLTCLLYAPLRALRRVGLAKPKCLCIGTAAVAQPYAATIVCNSAVAAVSMPALVTGSVQDCELHGATKLLTLSSARLVDCGHFLTAGAVSLARGLNDTPKIAALLLLGAAFSKPLVVLAVATAMALGGWLSARRVAETMSKRITMMSHGQGFTANLVTSAVVIAASKFGLPVSTTHVSCGALFGIGAVTGGANKRVIAGVVLSWVVTLPVAATLGAVYYSALSSSGLFH